MNLSSLVPVGLIGATGATGAGVTGATGPIGPTGATGGTTFTATEEPAIARRRRPAGLPAGTFENVFVRDVFNVQDYGAKPNDNTAGAANSTAIANAITALLLTNSGGTLYFPKGYWYITSAVSFNSATKNIRIVGDGIQSTFVIQRTANTGVFDITHANDANRSASPLNCTVENLAIGHDSTVSTQSTASGFKYTNLAGNNWPVPNLGPNLIMRNVTVNPALTDGFANQRGFDKFVHVIGASFVTLDTVEMYGQSSFNLGVGFYFDAGTGKSVVARLLNCYAAYMASGAEFVGGINGGFEGIRIDNCDFNGIAGGILLGASAGTVCNQVAITNTYIDIAAGSGGRNTCIEGYGAQIAFVGNDLYLRSSSVGIKGTFYEGSILGNTYATGGANTKGVVLENDSVGIHVCENSFGDSITLTGVEIGASVQKSRVESNTWSTIPTNALSYTTAGALGGRGNVIRALDGIQCSLYLTAAQTIVSGTEPAVNWSATRYNDSFASAVNGYTMWVSSTPERIYVPPGARRVQLFAGVFWATPSVGTQFQVKIKDNSGNSWIRDSRYSISGVGGGNFTGATAIIDVLENQTNPITYFFMTVFQNSGSDLNVNASQGTFLCMNVL
jgi:hypothetical protein